MGARLMAIVAEGDRGRVYLAPSRRWKRSADGETDVEGQKARCR